MKLALSTLCENPARRTGLTTLFHEFVSCGLKQFPDLKWLVFSGANQGWSLSDSRVEVVKDYPANDRLKMRLFADHFQVPARARALGADALLTIGFVPIRKSLPTIMHVFGLHHLNPENRMGMARAGYRNWMTRLSWPKADLIITNSKFAASQILAVYPEFSQRILQSYEGLQHAQFCAAAPADEAARLGAQFNLRPGYFLWVSNFYPYKQAELLLEGYGRLKPEIRRTHPLVMVGGDWNGGLGMAQARVQSLGIAGDVRFLGWVGDEWLAPLYRHARASCLASREETFGRCVTESMACGTPCVLNDIPVMREVSGGHALIVDYANASQVAAALESVGEDTALWTRLRDEGLQHARQFTFEKLTKERIEAIQKLLASRPR